MDEWRGEGDERGKVGEGTGRGDGGGREVGQVGEVRVRT